MPQYYYSKSIFAMGFAGALALAVPLTTHAQTTDTVEWNRGQAELQRELMPGKAPDTYKKKIEQLGYKITSTNYDNPDYLEYEVVKGDQSWEVQIDVDDEARRATEIEIKRNIWQTDATQAALREGQRMARTNAGAGAAAAGSAAESRRTTPLRNNQYSDRDRADTDQLIRELEALPVGRDKEYYKNTLRQRGYEITKINTDDADELELEAVKDGNSVQMEVEFDEGTGRSTGVDASSLWAESESTRQARESQEQRMGTSASGDRRSQMNRDNERMGGDTNTQNFTRPRSGSTVTPGDPSDRTSTQSDAEMDRRSQSEVTE
jgi:hypothetical protein